MRSFTIESINKYGAGKVNYTGGRFISETPSGAAKKAFTKAYHHLNAKGPMSLKICVRETTQGSTKKEHTYRVTKKSEKVKVERNGEIITYNFTTKTKSLK
jgi:hypothetical protein